jgi:hypothetical protein
MVYSYPPYVNTETWTRACRVGDMLTHDALEYEIPELVKTHPRSLHVYASQWQERSSCGIIRWVSNGRIWSRAK